MKLWLSACLLFLTGLIVRAEDWPQFRGPSGQGHSSTADLPLNSAPRRNHKTLTQTPFVWYVPAEIATSR